MIESVKIQDKEEEDRDVIEMRMNDRSRGRA